MEECYAVNGTGLYRARKLEEKRLSPVPVIGDVFWVRCISATISQLMKQMKHVKHMKQ